MGETTNFELPYFDQILERLEQTPDSPLSKSLTRHVHWGLYASPTADSSMETYLTAAETMTERLCKAGRVRNGLRILDVGCGFGGTVAHMNEHLTGCELVGLNIDERQLVRARKTVQARPTNTVRFVEGDACALPFEDNTFDAVLAVECIFHFPSRRQFFREARRVLRGAGTLAVSDFVVDGDKVDEMAEWTEANASLASNFYGVTSAALCTGTYPRIARGSGFKMIDDEDITARTMPTYTRLNAILGEAGMAEGVKATRFLEELSRKGFFQYRVMSFEATAA
jgi:ubiquinone/menaquinone biosynthesis C-methylase UbiE